VSLFDLQSLLAWEVFLSQAWQPVLLPTPSKMATREEGVRISDSQMGGNSQGRVSWLSPQTLTMSRDQEHGAPRDRGSFCLASVLVWL
jgi:hypothetical protein